MSPFAGARLGIWLLYDTTAVAIDYLQIKALRIGLARPPAQTDEQLHHYLNIDWYRLQTVFFRPARKRFAVAFLRLQSVQKTNHWLDDLL
jgi:hypothetical protein